MRANLLTHLGGAAHAADIDHDQLRAGIPLEEAVREGGGGGGEARVARRVSPLMVR